ncbi:MAG TPA: hypothetical protein PKX74_08430 [Leptospiraceae bacterium]|nr:hypothetical protein [Leptospirales bacterium]HMU83439.1 hypothetical protein [Leptospiraceae bacterium]HMY45491.1 hypothetical protein [Leptospiraceae bacterium]HMZ36872.1 hypothetical protein [Leptospiraceae bacterium]HNE23729.1 hypothetical protein [Leptospiraceae bacterium]
MRWQSAEVTAAAPSPWKDLPESPISFLVEVNGSNIVMVPGINDAPACILTVEEVRLPSTWTLIRRITSIPATVVARMVQPFLPVENTNQTLCDILGWKRDYQNLTEAADLLSFDSQTIQLSCMHDLPVPVLRLFARIQEKTQLLQIFKTRSVRKNLVREIILDLYDLEEGARTRVINELLRSAQSTDSLAGEDLRDLVRKERHPKSEQIRQQIKEIKKSMNLPSGLQIEVPADLENGQTKITLSFRRQEEFQKLLGEMDQAFSAKLSEILKLV